MALRAAILALLLPIFSFAGPYVSELPRELSGEELAHIVDSSRDYKLKKGLALAVEAKVILNHDLFESGKVYLSMGTPAVSYQGRRTLIDQITGDLNVDSDHRLPYIVQTSSRMKIHQRKYKQSSDKLRYDPGYALWLNYSFPFFDFKSDIDLVSVDFDIAEIPDLKLVKKKRNIRSDITDDFVDARAITFQGIGQIIETIAFFKRNLIMTVTFDNGTQVIYEIKIVESDPKWERR